MLIICSIGNGALISQECSYHQSLTITLLFSDVLPLLPVRQPGGILLRVLNFEELQQGTVEVRPQHPEEHARGRAGRHWSLSEGRQLHKWVFSESECFVTFAGGKKWRSRLYCPSAKTVFLWIVRFKDVGEFSWRVTQRECGKINSIFRYLFLNEYI